MTDPPLPPLPASIPLALLQQLSDPVYILDRQWRYVFANAASERLVGISLQQRLGRPIWEFFPEIMGTVFERECRRAVEEQIAIQFTAPFPATNFQLEVHLFPTPETLTILYRQVPTSSPAPATPLLNPFQQAFYDAPLAIIVTDARNRRIVQVNPRACDLLGYSAEELLQRGLDDITHPDDVPATVEHFTRAVAGEIPHYHLRKRFCRKDGSVVHGRVSVAPLRDLTGQIHLLNGFIEDITEQVRAETALAEAGQFHQQVIAGLNEGLIVYDSDLKFRVWNPFMEQLTGLPAATVLGRPALESFPFLRDVGVIASLEQALAGQTPKPLEFPFTVPATGRTGWAAQTNAPLRNRAGAIIGAVATVRDITARKQAEAALQASEAKYRDLFENSITGLYEVAPNNRFLRANRALANLLGFASPAELQTQVTDIAAQLYAEPPRRDELWRLLTRDGRAEDFELTARRKDGRLLWLSLNAQVQRAPDGSILYAQGSVLDITARKMAEDALIASEAQYRDLFENSIIGLFECTPEPRFLRANRALARLVGFDSSTQLLAEITNIEAQLFLDPARTEERWAIIRRDGRLENFEAPVRRRDGQTIWIALNAHAVFGPDGAITYIQGSVLDITARQQAEHALKESEERFRRAFEDAPLGTAIIRIADHRILRANAAFARMLGYTPEEMATFRTDAFTHPDDLDVHNPHMPRIQSGAVPQYQVTKRCFHKDGHLVHLRVSVAPIHPHHGPIVHLLGMVEDITAQLATEEALKESDNRFRILADAATQLIIVADARGDALFSNRLWQEFTGLTHATMAQRREAIHPDDRARVAREWEQAVAAKTLYQTEYRYRHRDGQYRWLLQRSVPQFDAAEQLVGWMATGTDIHELKVAEEALRQSELKYRQLFATMDEALALHEIICDPSGQPCDYRILDVNPAFERLTGTARQNLIGHTRSELWPNEDPHWLQLYGQVALTGHSHPLTRHSVVADKWFEGLIYCPAPGQFAGLFSDVTLRHRTEEALRQSEERFRSLAEFLPDGILVVTNRRVVYANPAAARLFGAALPAALVGRDVVELLPEDRRHVLLHDMESLLSRSGDAPTHEGAILRLDGSRLPVEAAAQSFYHNDEPSFVVLLHDISDRLQARREREAYQARLRKLASEIALAQDRERHSLAIEVHDDIAQNLASALLQLQLLTRDKLPPKAATLLTDTRELLDLTLARIRALTIGLSPPSLYELGLEAALDGLVDSLKKRHALNITLQTPTPIVRLDEPSRALLYRASRELLMNIVKHAQAQHVTVSLERAPGQIILRVADDGIGFDPPALTSHSGFGLFSLREQIEGLGGALLVESRPAHGTRIQITLPHADGGN